MSKNASTAIITHTPKITPLLTVAIALIFGGCCTNAWSLERLLVDNPNIGTALTFSQLVFIAIQTSSTCITRLQPYPQFKTPTVPIRTWLVQVVVLTSMALLNNWAFAYRVPLTLQIVFRSAGLAVSMILGYIFMKKTYSYLQVFSVLVVTSGVVVATLSRPATPSARVTAKTTQDDRDVYQYATGILMLGASCVLTSTLGILQEQTFAKHGKDTWREGVFYTHLLSLPTFALLFGDVQSGLRALSTNTDNHAPHFHILFELPLLEDYPIHIDIAPLYVVLALNVISQSVCVSGANLLTSEVSAVTTNLILTARKALSLCISVWYFGQGLNAGLAIGASIVLLGTVLYSYATTRASQQQPQKTTHSVLSEKGGRGRERGQANGHHAHEDDEDLSSTPAESRDSSWPAVGAGTRELRRRGLDGRVLYAPQQPQMLSVGHGVAESSSLSPLVSPAIRFHEYVDQVAEVRKARRPSSSDSR
ncbi:golgi uridine diphosphate-N- acetylglucosamine transporter [Tulasnella sp. 330]|nr:golgi uridine diphosphate-N- acetylglucosamine transporter [Tulasnella sp. 330]KAG8878149.1 golgi uridine diphosphate-N- acetylglucosamine transporter [Tulasnella sp. 331]KAG8883690.1 golgi uridine diphosphate-N- acetylglucosamine transporter [Tulasnella sp. 332]